MASEDETVPADAEAHVYDHASTDDAEAANAENTKKWLADQAKENSKTSR